MQAGLKKVEGHSASRLCAAVCSFGSDGEGARKKSSLHTVETAMPPLFRCKVQFQRDNGLSGLHVSGCRDCRFAKSALFFTGSTVYVARIQAMIQENQKRCASFTITINKTTYCLNNQ